MPLEPDRPKLEALLQILNQVTPAVCAALEEARTEVDLLRFFPQEVYTPENRTFLADWEIDEMITDAKKSRAKTIDPKWDVKRIASTLDYLRKGGKTV